MTTSASPTPRSTMVAGIPPAAGQDHCGGQLSAPVPGACHGPRMRATPAARHRRSIVAGRRKRTLSPANPKAADRRAAGRIRDDLQPAVNLGTALGVSYAVAAEVSCVVQPRSGLPVSPRSYKVLAERQRLSGREPVPVPGGVPSGQPVFFTAQLLFGEHALMNSRYPVPYPGKHGQKPIV